MKEKKGQGISIPFKVDDFFTNQSERDDKLKEKIEQIDISLIDDFKEHPFKVINNEELKSLKESINKNGVLLATIVRKKDNGRYEMISGHRRKFACLELGIETLPCVIKDLTDDEAIIYMVDSNLQREKILPSEKAYAYKMKYEAMKHQGKRTDLTFGPVDQKSTAELMGEETKESEKTIRRYIRLTFLVPKLLELVDNYEIGEEPKIALRPAVELSYLSKNEQNILLDYIITNLTTPSTSQAMNLKKLSENGTLTSDNLKEIMNIKKPNQIQKFNIQEDKLMEVLPRNIKREKIEDFVLKACQFYTMRLKQRNKER